MTKAYIDYGAMAPYIYIYIYIFFFIVYIYIINNTILCLDFNILHTKIPSYKFLNSPKYPCLLVK